MQPIPPTPPQPRKRMKTPKREWVLKYTLSARKELGADQYGSFRDRQWKERYASEKSANKAMEHLTSTGGKWNKNIWEVMDARVYCR